MVYKPSEENPEWTIAERSAWVDSKVMGFGLAIQAFGVERFKKNCAKTVRGFNHVLSAMFPPPASQPPQPHSTQVQSKLKGAAKKASELAKAKANSIYVTCEPS